MKVFELIAELKKLPPQAKLFVAADEEGNAFGPVEEITEADDFINKKNSYILWPGDTFTAD